MSYKNEIAIVFNKSQLSRDALEATNHLLKKLDFYASSESALKENDKYIQFFDNFIEWDDANNRVFAFNNFIDSLNEGSFSFLRVGEEIGDYEFKGSPDFGLSLIYRIDTDSLPL